MKKVLIFLAFGMAAMPGMAKTKKTGSDKARWALGVNLIAGSLTQNAIAANTLGNYLNAVSSNTGDLNINYGHSVGGDLEVVYYFGKQRNFGVGTGVLYMNGTATDNLDNYKVQFQAKDSKGNVFRQIITANSLQEKLSISNLNIPVMATYRFALSKKLSINIDAGLLFNLGLTNNYSTSTSIDYEAVYRFSNITGGAMVYDNAPIPSPTDWFLTKNAVSSGGGAYTVNTFDSLRARGYNVGLAISPDNKTGKVAYKSGTIGFILRPVVTYGLMPNLDVDLGFYIIEQTFSSNTSGYVLTTTIGSYNSPLKSVATLNSTSMGVNLGVKYKLGR